MAIRKTLTLFFGIVLSLSLSNVFAADIAAQKEALNVIADFADRICNKIPLEGSEQNFELSGEAKVELNNLLKKMADLGIKGAAKYQTSEYQGVLQKDLVTLIQGGIECKLKVWQDLKDKLIITEGADKEKKSKAYPDVIGASYEVTCNDQTERNIFTAIIQFTSKDKARWRYTSSTSWNEWFEVDSLSPHKLQLSIRKNDPSQSTWDLEFSEDFRVARGSFRFLQSNPPPTRWRNYVVSGSRLE